MTRRATNNYELEDELVNACHFTVNELRDVWMQPIHGERINQRRADKAGSDKGSPDYLLCVAGWHHPLEFKRVKGGRFGLDQIVAAERRRKAGVETYAPTRVTEFDALLTWSKRHFKGVCPDCPVVPAYSPE
jgi:hypothetical protein